MNYLQGTRVIFVKTIKPCKKYSAVVLKSMDHKNEIEDKANLICPAGLFICSA